jgi:hypothetical protein
MGRLDRMARFLIGVVLIYITLVDNSVIQNDVARYILAAIGLLNLVSAIISSCPMYVIAGIDTRKKIPTN